MGFGEMLKFEVESGENNKTQGKHPIQKLPTTEPDENGQHYSLLTGIPLHVLQTPYGFACHSV